MIVINKMLIIIKHIIVRTIVIIVAIELTILLDCRWVRSTALRQRASARPRKFTIITIITQIIIVILITIIVCTYVYIYIYIYICIGLVKGHLAIIIIMIITI